MSESRAERLSRLGALAERQGWELRAVHLYELVPSPAGTDGRWPQVVKTDDLDVIENVLDANVGPIAISG
jgi:hypothetical protein